MSDQLLLLLMLMDSDGTNLEFSSTLPAHQLDCLTECWLSVMEVKMDKTTGSSKTAGVLIGECLDSLRWLGTRIITAALLHGLLTQEFDRKSLMFLCEI